MAGTNDADGATISGSRAAVRPTRSVNAVVYAARAHRDQKRKGSDIPYVGHLLAVASIVIDYGGDEDEAIAALLHDAPEDQGGLARLDDIRTGFGERVASIVEACSDSLVDDPNKKDSWPVRKRAYLHHLAQNTDASVYLVSAADKLHNLRSMLADYFVVGEALWGRFSRDAGKVGIIRTTGRWSRRMDGSTNRGLPA